MSEDTTTQSKTYNPPITDVSNTTSSNNLLDDELIPYEVDVPIAPEATVVDGKVVLKASEEVGTNDATLDDASNTETSNSESEEGSQTLDEAITEQQQKDDEEEAKNIRRASEVDSNTGNPIPTKKKVSLTACPLTNNFSVEEFSKKILYVLGNEKLVSINDKLVDGFLYNSLSRSAGLIFPYTPSIDVKHQVNYDQINIMHSNLAYNYYKNTDTPSYSCSAKFTADNEDNALHMLSAIWFFSACTKCEFGENSNNPGLPPPVLYLSGYDQLLDNIPVIIQSFGYKLPDDKHYVNLVFDPFTSRYADDGTSNKFFLNRHGILSTKSNLFSFWLPMDLTITFQLKVQPNLMKVRKQWSLDKFKSGELMIQNTKYKNPDVAVSSINYLYGDKILASNDDPDSAATYTIQNENYKNNLYVTEKDEPTTQTIKFVPSGWTW